MPEVVGAKIPMTAVVLDIDLSLDGFVAAVGCTAEKPLGDDGERLGAWVCGADADRAPKPATTAGALISGRRTYDAALREWGGPAGPHPPTPVFVVTHAPPDQPPADSVYTFVTGGLEAALEQARSTAGERDVRIMGGAAIGQQFLAAGLVDEIVAHIVPVLLTAGPRMFESLGPNHIGLEILEVVDTPAATHVYYRISVP
jgi:dihydrofolate reductase